jgi:uncharacterized Tic20 family protein
MTSNNRLDWDYEPKTDGAIEIPVKVKQTSTAQPQQSQRPYDADDDVVREYEERYFGAAPQQQQQYANANYVNAPRLPHQQQKRKNDDSSMWERMRNFDVPPRHRYSNRRAPQMTGSNDYLWAAAAHASAIVTLIAALSSGPGVIFGLMIPLGIYLVFRTRSDYVAFHALQAFTFQTVCTVGSIVVIMALFALTVISAVASVFLIGIPFLILFIILLVIMSVFAVFTLFVLMPVYSTIAAFNAFNGGGFRYPWVADWVDDQLMNGKPRPHVV